MLKGGFLKKLITIFLVVAILTIATFSLVSCKNDEGTVVKINEVTHSVFYAPLYVAINNGYFEEVGLTIELTNGGGSDKTMTAIMSGQADIGLAGPETAIYVNAGGSSNYPIVFGQLTTKDGSFLIGRNKVENFNWSSLEGKEIIGGRKGGMPAMCLEYALYKNGLVNGKNVTINYDVQFDLIASAFGAGTGDYCTMFEPVATTYQNAGKGYIQTDVGSEAGTVPYTCFMATKDYIKDNQNTVKSFMKAILKGIDFVMNNDDLTVANALAPSFTGNSVDDLASAVKAYKEIGAFKTSPIMLKEDYDKLIDILKFSKVLDKDVAFEDVIDNSIVESLK